MGNNKNTEDVRGAEFDEAVETAKELEKEVQDHKKKQKVSVTYTLRAFGENVSKLVALGLINAEQEQYMRSIQMAALQEYVMGKGV